MIKTYLFLISHSKFNLMNSKNNFLKLIILLSLAFTQGNNDLAPENPASDNFQQQYRSTLEMGQNQYLF